MKIHILDLGFLDIEHAIAAFVIEGPEGLALVETGPASTLPHLEAALARNALLADIASRVPQLTPQQALARQADGALLLDVREESERAAGCAVGALGLSRGDLELRIAELVPDSMREIITMCGGGTRSLFAADVLHNLGYSNIASMTGGFTRWRGEGLPISYGALDSDAAERYSRHLRLPEVGVAGQKKLAGARVALIGAGGLGSPAALYLAAAGVGIITLIDDDRVERSNLQRQVLHADTRVGMLKTESAQIALNALNPGIRIDAKPERLQAANVDALLTGQDLIIDGADNFPTRYLLNAACRRLGLPLIYGAVHRFSGQVSVFDPRVVGSPCYRCLFPDPPATEDAPNCAEAGVLGVLPGIIGLLQANEALKLLLGIGSPLIGRLLCYDALAGSFRELRLSRDASCPGCSAGSADKNYLDVQNVCATN